MKVYLSGGMQYAHGGGAEWRNSLGDWIDRHLGHSVIDPVKESRALMTQLRRKGWNLRGARRLRGDWTRFFRLVVDRDTRLVRSADYVICLWNESARRGAGTQGELTIARDERVPVFLVTRSADYDLPGWIQGCVSRRFRTLDELKNFLLDRYPQ